MPYDSSKFATHLRKHAAKLYGPTLTKNGFRAIRVDKPETFSFQAGDIVVMGPTRRGSQAGHIAGYDGKNWISDFVQRGFWPGTAYEKETPSYVVYRR
jgi:hypothetical protein